ncbi:MAG: hypothetical protein ABIZ81_07450 [Opitutaceae bacterium]
MRPLALSPQGNCVGGVTSTIRLINGPIIVLNDSSIWEAGHLVSDLSTWSSGDPIEVTGPRAWSKMKNTKTNDMIVVAESRMPAAFPYG